MRNSHSNKKMLHGRSFYRRARRFIMCVSRSLICDSELSRSAIVGRDSCWARVSQPRPGRDRRSTGRCDDCNAGPGSKGIAQPNPKWVCENFRGPRVRPPESTKQSQREDVTIIAPAQAARESPNRTQSGYVRISAAPGSADVNRQNKANGKM
jgi:hypothetical protein